MYKSIIAFSLRFLFISLFSVWLLFSVSHVWAVSLQEKVTDILEEKIADQPDTQQDSFRKMLIWLLLRVAEKETTSLTVSQLLKDVVSNLQWETMNILSPQSMVDALNIERRNNGKWDLTLDMQLTTLAQSYASYLSENDLFTHTPTSSDPAPYWWSDLRSRIQNIEYNWISIWENIAFWQNTVDEVTLAWMNSQWHRENILWDFTRVWVARVWDLRVHVFAKQ